MALPGGMMDRAIQARKQAPGYNPNILGAFGQFMTGVGNLIQGRPYMSGPRVGQPGQYYGPAYGSAEALGIKPGGLRDYGPKYKERELAAGQEAEDFRAGAGFPGQRPTPVQASPAAQALPLDPYAAQNRAYQQERARVEAMVKANPDMQKQEIADARAKVRDQGMAIWAAKNPELAKQLQPGQVGYEAVQQALIGNEAGQAARSGYGYQMPQQMLMTPPPGVNAPQGLPGISSFEAASTYGQQGLDVDPEMRKKFQALINAQK